MLQLAEDRVSTILSTLRDRFSELSPRIVDMTLRCASGERPPLPAIRGVKNLFLPALETRAWHDPTQFPWLGYLEDATDEILEEYRRNAEDDLAYYLPDTDREATPVVGPDGLTNPAFGWKGVMLRRGGIWNRTLAMRYPATVSALRGIPLAAGDVMLSVLAPGSKIVPHTGLTNLDLTCHLGLDIPDDCGIEVGDETRTWTKGKFLVFDDTYRHWAWNRSTQPRLVLLFDVWHPGLGPDEIAQLKQALPLIYRS
jgi:hypothetical protein